MFQNVKKYIDLIAPEKKKKNPATSSYVTFVGQRTSKWKSEGTPVSVSPTNKANHSPPSPQLSYDWYTFSHFSHYHNVKLTSVSSFCITFLCDACRWVNSWLFLTKLHIHSWRLHNNVSFAHILGVWFLQVTISQAWSSLHGTWLYSSFS
jgi:hypothetical protein